MQPNSSWQLTCFTFTTPIGPVAVTASVKGLLTLALPPQSSRNTQHQPPRQFTGLIERLKAYFDGSKVAFTDTLDLSAATLFQAKVWEITRLIPYGETRSYRWVAEQMGQPAAVRAVGQALARNPLPVITPCHRVIGSDGNLGGFSYGLEMKQTLLRLEQPKTTSVREARSPIIWPD
ncbi:MAG: methylated-DNA--[protein]-cysteine S-methyltransferase [Dehalococcoidales bacterium]|nr:methylated-DNA--[protein]-cysteine S-methyltransferase [Dehalococcoidales bacterium]